MHPTVLPQLAQSSPQWNTVCAQSQECTYRFVHARILIGEYEVLCLRVQETLFVSSKAYVLRGDD